MAERAIADLLAQPVNSFLRWWGQHTCRHQFVRARFEDGGYGLRCMHCLRPYPTTWNDLVGSGRAPEPAAAEATLIPFPLPNSERLAPHHTGAMQVAS